MTIEEKDFRLTPISDSSPHFNLELLYKVKDRMEFKVVAYGVSLDYAIKKIAQYRICNKHKDKAVSLLNYFKEFKKEIDELKRS